MTTATTARREDLLDALDKLKDFQRKSVDYVFRRLYEDPDPTNRFLVADEVGLGKTLVARGVIAKAVDHLWEKIDRIDVIYICSNSDIARQNINRLRIKGMDDGGGAFSSRITMLPLHMGDLTNRKLNFVSFTPATSFELGRRSGIMRERALLYHLLADAWGLTGRAAEKNVLQGAAGAENWRWVLDDFERTQKDLIDQKLAERFQKAVKGIPGLKQRFEQLCEAFARSNSVANAEQRNERNDFIGQVRRVLARCCIDSLEPDLVILDEFQRFKDLLDAEDDTAQLARDLFQYKGVTRAGESSPCKVLLLSATPYKMYTLSHEGEDHFADFKRTVQFLFENDENATAEVEHGLSAFRSALCAPSLDPAALHKARDAVESRLRKVMCRTERLAVSADHNGLVRETSLRAGKFEPRDVLAFRALDKVAHALEVNEPLEFWKSSPYPLNLMGKDDYEIKRELVRALSRGDEAVHAALREAGPCLLDAGRIRRYEPADPANARMRGLIEHSVGSGGWRLLWIPASLPYYRPSGAYAQPGVQAFTKALLFSSWRVVPKAVAILASYEAERRMVVGGDGALPEAARPPYAELRKKQGQLIRFSSSEKDGRHSGMANFALLYPCATLALHVDPMVIGRSLAAKNGALATREEVLSAAQKEIETLLAPLLEGAENAGKPDDAWYWAAPLLLDAQNAQGVEAWLMAEDEDTAWEALAGTKDPQDSAFADHIELLRERFGAGKTGLGRPPEDLAAVLAKVAVGSPACVALRAIARLSRQEVEKATVEPLSAAAAIGLGFRSLFNLPETTLMLRRDGGQAPYWEQVLDYCVTGNLQAVVDEYVHVLWDGHGLYNSETPIADLADTIESVLSLRTTRLEFDEIVDGPEGLSLRDMSVRCRYAMQFGEGKPDEDDGGEPTREDQVRQAFNSPFRPFILASTSVGQEGLDFHQYCHAIFHWNLPSNPVDLEQREGRIHRFKGHAIRRNLAERMGLKASAGKGDPWRQLYQCGAAEREVSLGDLVPYWHFEGPHKIERHIPMYPLSRDEARFTDLKKALALYRVAFGQPRQEDLVAHLIARGLEVDARSLMDLSPR